MAENDKRFEDWPKVDCNDCVSYWDDSCDGVPQGLERPCNSFKATRSIVIPAKIKELERRFNWLRISLLLTDIMIVIHLLTVVVGG